MKKLFPLYVIIFVAFFGYSIQIPIFSSMILDPSDPLGKLPIHAREYLPLLIGILLSMYPLGQFIGAPILGALSDRYGRRKMILWSLCACVLTYILICIVVSFRSYPLLLGALFLAGLAEGNIAIAQGAIVDVTTDENRSQYFGYIYVASSLGFIVGPLVSSLFSDKKLVSWFGPETNFIIATGLILFITIWTYFSFEETLARKHFSTRDFFSQFTNLSRVFTDRHLRFYYGLNFLLYFSIFGFFRVYSTFLIERYHLSLVILSLVVSYVALPIVLINLFVSPLLSKLRKPKIITIISTIFMGCSMISITIFQPFNSIWFTLLLTSIGIGVTMPFSASIISFMANREQQGSVMGNNQSLLAAAQGIASIFGGALAMFLNILPLIIFGIISIISGFLLFRHSNEYGHHENITDDSHLT